MTLPSTLAASLRAIVLAFMGLFAGCQDSSTVQQDAAAGAAQTRDFVAVLAAAPGQGARYNGFAERVPSENLSSVVQRALASCQSARCKIVQTWRQGDCFGIVRGEQFIWWNIGLTLGEASNAAMKTCLDHDSACALQQNKCL